jgi:hypothetical protein
VPLADRINALIPWIFIPGGAAFIYDGLRLKRKIKQMEGTELSRRFGIKSTTWMIIDGFVIELAAAWSFFYKLHH